MGIGQWFDAIIKNVGLGKYDSLAFLCECGHSCCDKTLRNGIDLAIYTIMSNMGLYKACDAIGIHTEKTAVGDKYVAENMMTNGYVLGGEQSGHIIFGKYATTGDGILTSLMVMMAMLDKKMPLSMLADEMRVYPQCLKNVKLKANLRLRMIPMCRRQFRRSGIRLVIPVGFLLGNPVQNPKSA